MNLKTHALNTYRQQVDNYMYWESKLYELNDANVSLHGSNSAIVG
jgi:hypothetical protein